MATSIKSFHFLAYRMAGGGMIFKAISHEGNIKRFAIGFEALAHLQTQIEKFVAENSYLRDTTRTPQEFLTEFTEARPQVSEEDSEGLGEEAFKARFIIEPAENHIRFRTLDLNGRVEDFFMSYETIWYLGLRIEGMLQQLRS